MSIADHGPFDTKPIIEPTQMDILLIGPTCDGTDVGEAWSTYQWARGLSERHQVTLLTYRKRERPSAVEQLPNVEVIEWTDLPLVGRFERFNAMAKPGYARFYWHARRWLNRARQSRHFDIVHQVAPLALRYPCPATGMDWPVVVGPVAGSLETPSSFREEVDGEQWYIRLRRFDHWRFRRDPWLRATYQQADMVIGVAPYVRSILGDISPRHFAVCSETGVTTLPDLRRIERTMDKSRLQLLYVGRIVRTKGLRDTIRALKLVPSTFDWELQVVGDGPDRAACEHEARDLGVVDKIKFHGRVPRNEVDRFYGEADVFVFPSFREPSGNVVLEAMSHGLPCIVSERGGPAEVVTEACGFQVTATDPSSTAQGIAEALTQLANDPKRRMAMGVAARERIATTYLWPRKIAWLTDLYQHLLSGAKPLKAKVPATPQPI